MFAAIDPDQATGATKELLETTRRQLGRIPNLYRTMANSPTALAAYLAFRDALQKGDLAVEMRERVALLTAQQNSCDYCVAAHTFRSQKLGLSAQDIEGTRRAISEDGAVDAALKFIAELHDNRGQISEFTLTELARYGWTEASIGELVAHVALNTFSNYFKHVAHPELDFPPAPALISEPASTLEYAVEATNVQGQWTAKSNFQFEETISRLRHAIAAHELLLISEIDPQKILMSAGMKLRQARQMLFFHPRYMKRLLQADARAVTEVPMKIVVLAAVDGTVVLRGPEFTHAFAHYSGLVELATELDALRSQIIATVAA